jgi:hypothetical protein
MAFVSGFRFDHMAFISISQQRRPRRQHQQQDSSLPKQKWQGVDTNNKNNNNNSLISSVRTTASQLLRRPTLRSKDINNKITTRREESLQAEKMQIILKVQAQFENFSVASRFHSSSVAASMIVFSSHNNDDDFASFIIFLQSHL